MVKSNGLKKIAVLQFPGSNCEEETARAVRSAGMDAAIYRWNADPKGLAAYDGYVIGGGFSYQDRVRAGAIAAKEPIMDVVAEESAKGKPVLGICNGAQVLVETGLVPATKGVKIEMALAANVMVQSGRTVRRDYYCNWVFLKNASRPGRCAFNLALGEGEIIPIPMAHGEGRFTTVDKEVLRTVESNNQIVLQYVDAEGNPAKEFPANPNGSMLSIAGLCNPAGNVMAMMPHPERANELRQVPTTLGDGYAKRKLEGHGNLEALKQPGPGRKIFESMRMYLEQR